MTFAQLPLWVIHAVGFLYLAVSTGAMTCIVRAIGKTHTARYVFLNLPVLLFAFPVTFCLEEYCRSLNYHSYIRPYSAFVVEKPAWLILSVVGVLAVFEIASRLLLEKRLRRTLSSFSVSEGLDTLPDGVLFSTQNGVPLLVNHTMREICSAAFGLTIMDYGYLKRRLAREELSPGCRLERHSDGMFLHLPDGGVRDLREQEISFNGVAVLELIAYDVTAFYRGNEELRERNERLAAVNAQIREYNRSVDAIVRDKEILAAKIHLHDDFGKALLAIKAYLLQPGGQKDTVLDILKTPVFLFRNEAEPVPEEDRFTLLEEAGRAIGVTIRYDGALPETQQDVLVVAIHECLTNTVKHAGGHLLSVKSRLDGDMWTVAFTNDGRPPAGPVEEVGGLANLRALAESHGVEMCVGSEPAFSLTLRFHR